MRAELLAQASAEDAPSVIHVPQWGCGLMIVVAVLLVAALVRAVRRAAAADRRSTAERLDGTLRALIDLGVEAERAAFPGELPHLGLVPAKGRPKECLRATADGLELFLFEYMSPGSSRPPLGRNAEETGSGAESGLPSYTSRHTIACVRSPGRTWPEVELLPSIGGALRRAASGDLAVPGAASVVASQPPSGVDPRLGLEMAEKMLGMVGKLADPRTPVPLDSQPALAAAYVAYGADGATVEGLVAEPVVAWLLDHPGAILCLSGEWLLLSRNVRVAGVAGEKNLPFGFLPAAMAGELAADAVDLARLLVRYAPRS